MKASKTGIIKYTDQSALIRIKNNKLVKDLLTVTENKAAYST